MDDYISREAALKAIYTSTAPALEVKAMPAADVKPVVRGKWMNEEQEGFNVFSAECDQCRKRTLAYFHYNFCPNCGADMREVT